jgi:hypothetical protein
VISPTLLALSLMTASGGQSRYQLSLGGSAYYVQGNFSGGAQLGATVFADRPVIDDDAPFGLQPWLQRLTTLNFRALALGSESGSYGYMGANIDAYVHKNVALLASVTWGGTHSDGGEQYGVAFGAGLAARFYDHRVELGYDNSWPRQGWGRLQLRGVFCVEKVALIALRGFAYQNGVGAGAELRIFPLRILELDAFASLSRGALDTTQPTLFIDAGGSLSIWFARMAGLAVAYDVQWYDKRFGDASHTASLSFFVRPPSGR